MHWSRKIVPVLQLSALAAVSGAQPAHAQNQPGTQALTSAINEQPATQSIDPQDSVAVVHDRGGSISNANGTVFVGAVQIDGLDKLSPSLFVPVIEKAMGREAQPEDLVALAGAIANTARTQGYIFASAIILPQTVQAGVLRVQLDEGAVDEVRISGSDNGRLRSILHHLISRSAQKDEVERQLLLAADVPGITITKTRYVRENGKGVLLVDVHEDRGRGLLVADNQGPDATGPVRVRLSYNFNSLLTDGDVLYVQLLDTVVEPEELAYGFARYGVIVNDDGLQASVYGSLGHTRPGGRLQGFDLSGRSWQVGTSASYPLLRSQQSSLWLSADFALLSVLESQRSVPILRDRIATATVGINGSRRLGDGRLYGGMAIVRGFDVLGATRAGDPMASRSDADGTFTKGYAWFNWLTGITERLSMRVSGQGQLSFDPLLSAQEIGLGGPYYGRGYDFSERTGDNGALGLIELRRRFPMSNKRWMQLYVFADGGVVDNLRDGFGSGSLASTGSGLRAGFGKVEVAVEGALPLSGPRFDSGDRSPKVNFSLGVSF